MLQAHDNSANFNAALRFSVLALRAGEEAYEAWRDRVYMGIEEYSEEVDTHHHEYLEEWLENFEALLPETDAQDWNGTDEDVRAPLIEIQEGAKRIHAILQSWQAPALAKNPSFRRLTISGQESMKIDGLIETGSARITAVPQKLV